MAKQPQPISRDFIVANVGDAPLIYDNGHVRIARISESLAVKYGRFVYLCEANTMSYVAKRTRVRLPKAHDAREEATTNSRGKSIATTYSVMNFIEGDLVADAWSALSPGDRLGVFEQIREMVEQLQEITVDSPGPIDGGVSNGAYCSLHGAGPFHTRKDMEEWFDERLLVCKEYGSVRPEVPAFAGSFQKLDLCHLDLHDHNMILDETGKVWLIDWANLGAYPPYFEQAGLLNAPSYESTSKLFEILDDGKFTEEIKRLEGLGFALTTGALLKPTDRNMRIHL